MLTVLAAAARAASEYVSARSGLPADQAMGRKELGGALDAIVAAAWNAVVQTEGQLPALAEAHVVDAGGMGLLLVLDSLRATVAGTGIDPGLLDGLHGFAPQDPHIHRDRDSPVGFELMCSISLEPLAAATLRFELNEVGDSVIMSPVDATGDGEGPVRWRVHAHVEDREAAVALVRRAGDPENLVITALRDPEQPR